MLNENNNIHSIDSVPTKCCTKCGSVYPATFEYWYRKPTGKYGFRPVCKTCTNATNTKWQKENPERSRELSRRYAHEHPERRRESTKKWRSKNRDKVQSYLKKWRMKNRAKVRIMNRAWRVTIKGKASNLMMQQNRKARKKGVINNLTSKEWLHALDYFENKCAYCGEFPKLGQVIAADHFIPLVHGGDTTATNIIPACHSRKDCFMPSCNIDKGTRQPIEWITEKFGKPKGTKIIKRIQAYFESLNSNVSSSAT